MLRFLCIRKIRREENVYDFFFFPSACEKAEMITSEGSAAFIRPDWTGCAWSSSRQLSEGRCWFLPCIDNSNWNKKPLLTFMMHFSLLSYSSTWCISFFCCAIACHDDQHHQHHMPHRFTRTDWLIIWVNVNHFHLGQRRRQHWAARSVGVNHWIHLHPTRLSSSIQLDRCLIVIVVLFTCSSLLLRRRLLQTSWRKREERTQHHTVCCDYLFSPLLSFSFSPAGPHPS